MFKQKGKPPTPATGALREKAQAWWDGHMRSRVTEVYLKGDGYLRFEWEDGTENGSYHLPVSALS